MSYILDALRKADAQRERDPARGIHAQAAVAAGASRNERGVRAKRLWAAGSLAVAALLLAAGWYAWRGDPAQRTLAAAATAPANAAAQATAPAVAAKVAVAAVQPALVTDQASAAASPAPAVRRAQQAQVDPSTGTPRTARAAAAAGGAGGVPPPPAPAAPPPTVPVPTSPPPAMPAPAAPAPAGAAAAQPARATAGLPPEAPKIAISGGVYSASPAQRMLIVNGQVFNEGSEIAPGVTIEEIKARTAVLKFKGTRYTLAY